MKKISYQYLPVYFVFCLLVLSTSGFPFFWDTVQLASRHAHYFYETGFSSMLLPADIDSGHLPGLGLYIAFIWKIFGKSLVVSHLAMLPFVCGIVYQSIRLTSFLFPKRWRLAALVLLLADATLLAQCTLVSPDVPLVFFFLMALNGIFQNKKVLYASALAGLVISSMRGMMLVAGLFAADAIIRFLYRKGEMKDFFKQVLQLIPVYLPAAAIAAAFLEWHYYKTGWIGYHQNMPWHSLFETATPPEMVKNIGILLWRLIDMGRLFFWIGGAVCLWHYYRHRPAPDRNLKSLLIITIFILAVLGQAVILHKGLAQHRYLLPVYISFAMLVCYYIFNFVSSEKFRKWFIGITIAGMLSGNFWIYPDRIAKGWDSTLAYLPYFHLREKMMDYMKKEKIPLKETGSSFPNQGPLKYIDLSSSEESFAEPDLQTKRYIFYSNVYNSFSDDEIRQLQSSWKTVKEYRFLQVRVILYKK